jgi:hypothetical protein
VPFCGVKLAQPNVHEARGPQDGAHAALLQPTHGPNAIAVVQTEEKPRRAAVEIAAVRGVGRVEVLQTLNG